MRVEFVAGARETRRKPAQPADCTTEVADCTTEVAEPWRRDAHVAKEFVKCPRSFHAAFTQLNFTGIKKEVAPADSTPVLDVR